MITVDDILPRLKGVRRAGRGWMALCPAHPDKNPSLKVDEGTDGRALLYCFAGCSYEEIVSALGLKPGSRRRGGKGRAKPDPAREARAMFSAVLHEAEREMELALRELRRAASRLADPNLIQTLDSMLGEVEERGRDSRKARG